MTDEPYFVIPVFENGNHLMKDGWYIFQIEGKKTKGTTPELRKKFGKNLHICWWKHLDLSTGRVIEASK